MSIRHYLPGVIAITILILMGVTQTHGQHGSALKAHTFRTIDGLYTIGYEQAFNSHVSAEFSLQGGRYIDIRPNRLEDYVAKGIAAIGSIRYYPFTKKSVAPEGFFGYAALRYVDFHERFLYTATGSSYNVGGNIVNAGLGIGYKFVYRRLGLEGFVGWGAGRLKSDDDEYRNHIPEYYQSSIEEQEHFPQLDIAICYMFSPFSRD